MEDSKFKLQSSREVQRSNEQKGVIEREDAAWWEDIDRESPMILREESAPDGQRHAWDLEERTAVFGERIVRFSKKVPRHPANDRLMGQVAGAGTSVGANYCEASQCVSKKDFKNTVARCVKEAKETKFFLRMIVASEPQLADEARPLYREAHELLCIFASMHKK